MKSFSKSKASKNATGPGFRTADHFKGSIFSGSKFSKNQPQNKAVQFTPGLFKTQHKG